MGFVFNISKTMFAFIFLLALIQNASMLPPPVFIQPEQVHISYGEFPDEMMVVWSTFNDTKLSIVRYGLHGRLTQEARGSSRKFTDPGPLRHTQYIHSVLLKGLASGGTYNYVVGSEYGFSVEFSFTAMQTGQDWSPRLLVFGDMGNVNARALPLMEQDADAGMYDAVLHVGDIAYNMYEDNGRVGDEFMRQIEPLASRLPYMTCPGNHENSYNFTHYRNRFVMPRDNRKMYYSFNMGPVHFVSISTELIFFWKYGPMQIFWQYEWLKADLAEANKPENRAKQPWVIVFGHRPMYCSNDDVDDCTKHESITRVGLPILHIFGLEDVLYDNGVDLAFWAHEHSYERLFPVYNRKVMNGSVEEPYTNPKAPVHIVTGSAGCREDATAFDNKTEAWSAFRSSDYGYTRMNILNKTHLYLEQVSENKGGKVIDNMMLIKTSHGAYGAKKMAASQEKPDYEKASQRLFEMAGRLRKLEKEGRVNSQIIKESKHLYNLLKEKTAVPKFTERFAMERQHLP